jgi:hypothetical protein
MWLTRLAAVPMNRKSPAAYTVLFFVEPSSFQFSAFQNFSFTQTPLFPALRSSPTAVSGAYSQKQIPSGQIPYSKRNQGQTVRACRQPIQRCMGPSDILLFGTIKTDKDDFRETLTSTRQWVPVKAPG